MKTIWMISSPIGKLTLQLDHSALEAIHFGEIKIDGYEYKKTELTQQVIKELEEYFQGERKRFTLPLSLEGTYFQKKVWEALEDIPFGETRTYKEIATKIGHEGAYRAVGSANNKNKIPIVIPCHRVIASNGKLAGYAGGMDLKEKLLNLEKKTSQEGMGLIDNK